MTGELVSIREGQVWLCRNPNLRVQVFRVIRPSGMDGRKRAQYAVQAMRCSPGGTDRGFCGQQNWWYVSDLDPSCHRWAESDVQPWDLMQLLWEPT